MNKDNSAPAFPSDSNEFGSVLGMSLRDYFAAKALQGMISTAGAPCLFGLEGCEHDTAKAAYKIADAMLAARSA